MAKRKTKSPVKRHPLHKHESNMKAIGAFLVLFIAFGVYLLFNNYSDNLTNSPTLKFFMVLVIVLFALLIGLLFLVNPDKRK